MEDQSVAYDQKQAAETERMFGQFWDNLESGLEGGTEDAIEVVSEGAETTEESTGVTETIESLKDRGQQAFERLGEIVSGGSKGKDEVSLGK